MRRRKPENVDGKITGQKPATVRRSLSLRPIRSSAWCAIAPGQPLLKGDDMKDLRTVGDAIDLIVSRQS